MLYFKTSVLKTLSKRILTISITLLAITSISFSSEDTQEFLYQKALYLETARADYREAVKIYSEISKHEGNKEIVAKSLFRMVECYEKLGENDKANDSALKLINYYKEYIVNIAGAEEIVKKYEVLSVKQTSKVQEEKTSDTNISNFEITEKIINEKAEKPVPENIINTNMVNLFNAILDIGYERLLPADSIGMLLVFRYASGGSNIFSGIGCSVGLRWYVEENIRKSFLGGHIYIQNTGTTSDIVGNEKYNNKKFYIGPVIEYGYRWIFGNFTLFPTLMVGYVFGSRTETVFNVTTGDIIREHTYGDSSRIISSVGLNIGISF